jgi:hypothetical protein
MTGTTITERRDRCACTEETPCLWHYDQQQQQRRTARTVWSRSSRSYDATVQAVRHRRRGHDAGEPVAS